MRKYKLHSTHFLFALLWVCGLSACSPQQRLSCLLRHHPELMVRDTVRVFDLSVPIAPASDTTYLPIGAEGSPLSNNDCDRYCDSVLQAALSEPAVVRAAHAEAALSYADHTLALVATQLPDTVIVSREVSVPVVEYVAVEREKPERPMRTFFRISGIIAWSVLALLLALRIIRLFCKV